MRRLPVFPVTSLLSESRSGARNWGRGKEETWRELRNRTKQQKSHRTYISSPSYGYKDTPVRSGLFRHGGCLLFSEIANLCSPFEVLEEVHGGTATINVITGVCVLPLAETYTIEKTWCPGSFREPSCKYNDTENT